MNQECLMQDDIIITECKICERFGVTHKKTGLCNNCFEKHAVKIEVQK